METFISQLKFMYIIQSDAFTHSLTFYYPSIVPDIQTDTQHEMGTGTLLMAVPVTTRLQKDEK
jgi:hypothetical protein